ncbi:hypothetical protein Misp01_29340 [Microtetraspora sp. NBRC 13810]|uniref:terpene synthase family protein n=1 Tax=Microtetraspora sp. NBRC 13810 TaxID=3030990 RepID=UPI0024A16AC1|nr:hypothetical protein [Microtetraspora sp. NBRC 13810]GLW07804.1 hypothetical protein Misp01_29340 [Microtetraspora sp. NBRC 13810]
MEDVKIPDLSIPFPARLNPFEAEAAEHTTAWATRIGLIAEETDAARFAGESYARLVARLYPEASLPDLKLAADLNSWFHVFDDQFELADVGRDQELARRLAARAESLLRGEPLNPTAGPVLRGLADLRHRMRIRGGDRWWARFSRNMRLCLDAALWEVDNRASEKIPDPDTYIDRKLDIAYVAPSFDLIELIEHFEVPSAIRNSPEYVTLLHEAGHVVVCTNDVIGLRRELLQGEFHNLVIVLAHASGSSLQEAVDEVEETVCARVGRYLAAREALEARFARLGVEEHIRQAVRRCVTGLEDWMRGYRDWALETRRFTDLVLRGEVGSFHRELAD